MDEKEFQRMMFDKLVNETHALRLIVYRLLAIIALKEDNPAEFFKNLSEDVGEEIDRHHEKFGSELYEEHSSVFVEQAEKTRKTVSEIFEEAMLMANVIPIKKGPNSETK